MNDDHERLRGRLRVAAGGDLAPDPRGAADLDASQHCALENTHPHVTAAVEYAGMGHVDLRALCKRNEKNKLTSQFDADVLPLAID